MMARLLILVLALLTGPARAEQITVAVAANFLTTARDIAAVFEAETGHEVQLVHGSTGKLFAQIRAGAPFDLFLSADAERPALLVAAGLVAPGDTMAYAIGRLALVHGERTVPGTLDEILARPDLRIAIADPAVAPYGAAARTVLRGHRGGDWDAGLVYGESVGQAFSFIATGNTDIGLVALAQALTYPDEIWVMEIPDEMHDPLRQDAAILSRGAGKPAARAFFEFLDAPFARAILAEAGYELPL